MQTDSRRKSLDQGAPQLQVNGEALHCSTPAWVARLSRPSTAPAIRAAFALGTGARADPDPSVPSPPDSRRSTQERSSRRSGVPSWVDRLANKPNRGRAASPARAADAPLSRPDSAAARARSSQATSTSGRPSSRQSAWDADAIKESLARLRASRSSTTSEHSTSSKDFRIPAIRRGDDSARDTAVQQQAACRPATGQESSHSSADENAAVLQPRSAHPAKPKPEDSAQAHHRAPSADHFPRPALLQPAPLPPGYRPSTASERRAEVASPAPSFKHPAATSPARNGFAISHFSPQQQGPKVTPLGTRRPSGILSTEVQAVPMPQPHPVANGHHHDTTRPATAGPKLEQQPTAGEELLVLGCL